MTKLDHAALQAFLMVAQERSFTRAAAKIGISQSALSHAIRTLEEGLGVQLLARTTRSVAATAAGEKLVHLIGGNYQEIESGLAALAGLRQKPAGIIRITTGEHAAQTVLWPKLKPFLRRYPEINIELISEQGLIDIVARRYDAGVRLGEQLAKDMLAVRIGPDFPFIVVGAPQQFAAGALPRLPQDLVNWPCINLHLPSLGGRYAWEFEKGKRQMRVRVEGRLVMNRLPQIIDAALNGFGLAYVPEDLVRDHLAHGKLKQVLQDWCPPTSGYHLYFTSRRQQSPAFAAMVEALRFKS